MAKAPLYPVLVLLLYSNRLGNTSVLPNKRGVGAVCRPPFLLGVVSHFQTCAGGLTQPHFFRGPFLLEATVASKLLPVGLPGPHPALLFRRHQLPPAFYQRAYAARTCALFLSVRRAFVKGEFHQKRNPPPINRKLSVCPQPKCRTDTAIRFFYALCRTFNISVKIDTAYKIIFSFLFIQKVSIVS